MIATEDTSTTDYATDLLDRWRADGSEPDELEDVLTQLWVLTGASARFVDEFDALNNMTEENPWPEGYLAARIAAEEEAQEDWAKACRAALLAGAAA